MSELQRDYGIVERQMLLTRKERRPWPVWLAQWDITLYFLLLVLVLIDLFVGFVPSLVK